MGLLDEKITRADTSFKKFCVKMELKGINKEDIISWC